ncbi:MAG: two-component system sensor histidine kinase FlrB [Oleiphilaceae bacterium]|jgi:two-component system sensor histidine kinase FlrB
MAQQKITSWIDEPTLISSESLGASVVRSNYRKKPSKVHSQIEFEQDQPVENALSLFDKLSSQLTHSYRNLENKVSQLKTDLSEEESQRRKQLKEKEKIANRLSTLLDILPAGVVLLDESGKVTECNPAAKDLLGEPLEGSAWLDVIKRCFSPKHDDGHEVSLKDGRRVRIETRSMQSGQGQLILLSDLTETRLLQEKVSRAERLSSLGRMMASLAHQIRTPLSTAMLYAGHLAQTNFDEALRIPLAEKLLSRLTHLEHQIRDMLVFAKGDSRLAEKLKVDAFVGALQQAIEPVCQSSGITCNWLISPIDKVIMCNKETLVGACLNLINNSIEAGVSAKKTNLKIDIELSSEDEKSIILTVKDNGPGIPSNNMQKVFEPFYTTKPQGTGLGLAVVQAVVKAHGGEFRVRSTKQGVNATVRLPAYKVNQSDMKR